MSISLHEITSWETVETVEIDEIEEKPTLEQFRELLRKVEEFKRDCIDAGAAHEVYLCEVLLRLYTVLGRYQWCRQLGWTSTAAFRSAKEVGTLTSGSRRSVQLTAQRSARSAASWCHLFPSRKCTSCHILSKASCGCTGTSTERTRQTSSGAPRNCIPQSSSRGRNN